jgi:hypothetical protein
MNLVVIEQGDISGLPITSIVPLNKGNITGIPVMPSTSLVSLNKRNGNTLICNTEMLALAYPKSYACHAYRKACRTSYALLIYCNPKKTSKLVDIFLSHVCHGV